jgi:drug/metabolite transporter (DMT)-like permease
LAIKFGLRDLPPISYAAIRFLIAVVVLFIVSIGRVALLPPRKSDYAVLALTGVFMFTLNYGLLFWGELYVSSGLAAVLQASIPIFGMVFAHWMLPDEPLRARKLFGALLALGGVAVICAHLLDFNGLMAFWAGLGIVLGAAGAAFSNVWLKGRSMRLAPAMLAAWQMIFGTIPMLFIGFLMEGNPCISIGRASLSSACFTSPSSGPRSPFSFLWLMPRMSVTNLQTISLITPPGAVASVGYSAEKTFALVAA